MAKLLFLDDYLSQPDFRAALREPAKEFRQEVGLPLDCDELGVVCPDVEAAADHLMRTYPGMGPFFLGEGGPKVFSTDGKEHPYRTRVGFGYYQGILIELAEPGEGSSIFATHLDPKGRITLHHMGYYGRGDELKVDDHPMIKGLRKAGFPKPEWEAQVAIAGVVTHVSIFETYAKAEGLAIEFLDFRIGSVDGIKTVMPRAPMEALAWLQIKHGPRVLVLPEPGQGLKKRWEFKWERDLAGTPDQVWPYVIDPQYFTQWAMAKISLVKPGTDGKPDSPGMVRQVVVEVAGIQNTIIETVDKTEKPNHIWYHTISGGGVVDQKAEMSLKATEHGTNFRWNVSFIPEIFGTGWLLHKMVDVGTEESLDRLVRLMDLHFGVGLSNDHLPKPAGALWGLNQEKKMAIFRVFDEGDWSYLKIKGDLAWELYKGMTRCEPNPNDHRRRGVNMLGSLDNVVDGPVVELRFSNRTHTLGRYPAEFFELKHAMELNFERGKGEKEGDLLRISGDAGAALSKWLGHAGKEVVFEIISLERGEVRVKEA